MYHLVSFELKPKMQLEKSMLLISIDIDVGSKLLGIVNEGKNDANVHDFLTESAIGKIEEVALPIFVNLFENIGMPVTFAIRGQMVNVDSTTLELLLDSSVRHDIGSHGFFHRRFETLSYEEAETELSLLSKALKRFDVTPRSFIFPKNSVAHLNLLEKYGYKCYRSKGNFMLDSMRIEKHGKLYNVCPSLFLDQSINSMFLEKILDVAVEKRAPLHFWFHLWNFGTTEESIRGSVNRTILPLLKHAEEKVNSGLLTFETMLSAAKKIEAVSSSRVN